MNIEAQTKKMEAEVRASKHIIGGEGVLGYAVIGCLAAGTIGIYKSVWSEGLGAASCLVGSILAFGTICHIYYGNYRGGR